VDLLDDRVMAVGLVGRDGVEDLGVGASVEARFRDYWWQMRTRHIERFVHAFTSTYDRTEVDGLETIEIAEAMACMVEQAAYVWYAQEELRTSSIPVERAARIATRSWYRTFFNDSGDLDSTG
jgi:hypothetical protein